MLTHNSFKFKGLIPVLGRVVLFCFLLFGSIVTVNAQTDIWALMNRTDISISEIEKIADAHFAVVGTGKGSGYKQYQRWLYERKFHLDKNGYFINPASEVKAYQKFLSNQKQNKASTITWTEDGPTAWSYTSGWNPGVGRVTSVSVLASDTNTIYVSAPGGGIWKSTNNGKSWTPLMDNTNNGWMNVTYVCVDPNNAKTLFASVGSVIKSVNAGSSWTSTGSGPANVKKVLIHPTNSSIVFAVGTNGIYRSTNGGTAWTQVETADMEDIEFNPFNLSVMYASGSGTTKTVVRSINGGVTWTAIGSTQGITATGRTLISISPANPAIVYACQASGSNFGKLYRSSDTGKTFTTVVTGSPSSGTNYFGYKTDGSGTAGQASYDMAMCVNPKDANDVYIAGIMVWRSTNGGSTFTALTDWRYPNSFGYNHADVHYLEMVNGTIYSGSDGGIYKSVDKGDNWVDLSVGLGIRQVYRISCSKSNANIYNIGTQDNGTSYHQANGTWIDWIGADGMDNAISPINPKMVIGTGSNGGIFKTSDAGGSETLLTQPASGNWVTPIVMHPSTHDTIFGGWTGVWRSDNFGTSWTNISSGVITSKIDALAVAPSNPKYIYAAVSTTLYRTSNGGSSWTSVTAAAAITSICVSPLDPQKIWITCNNSTSRVFVSTNMGTSFTDISSGLPALVARSVSVEDNSLEGVYVGMNIGVYYRDNKNTTWIQHGTGLPPVSINEVEVHKIAGKLRVATYGRGVWESPLQNSNICSQPTALSTSNIKTTAAFGKWLKVTGAKAYSIDYKTSASSNWIHLLTTTDTFYSFSKLSPGTAYDWRVKTICTTDSSATSQVSFTTIASCKAVSGLVTSTITTKSAHLKWTSVLGSKGYILQYKLTSGTNWLPLLTTTDSSYDISGLSAGTGYDWRVISICSIDTAQAVGSSFVTVSPCPTVSGLNTKNITLTSAILTWLNVKGNTGFTIEYKTKAATSWVSGGTTTDTFLNLSSLQNGTDYVWRVRSNCRYDSSGFSNASFTTLSTCLAPTKLSSGNITANTVSFKWAAVKGAISYTFEYKTSVSSTWIGSTILTDTFYNLGSLTPGTTYDWHVRTLCASGNSAFTAASFTTLNLCLPPTNAISYNQVPGGITVGWSAVKGVTNYSVEYKLSSASSFATSFSTVDTFYKFTSLPAGVYDWRVRANCVTGNTQYLTGKFIIYCAAMGFSTAAEFIDKVNVGGLIRSSGSDQGYFNGLNLQAAFKPGSKYGMTLSAGFTGSARAEYWKVFIDFNSNGSYDDAGETILQFTSKNAADTLLLISIPTSAPLGKTTMRIAMKNGGFATSCESFNYGEVEDYSVLISNAVSLPGVGKNFDKGLSVNVFPIPASDLVNISYEIRDDLHKLKMTVTDEVGRIVYENPLEHTPGNYTKTIDSKFLQNGVYFISFQSETGLVVRKILICH